MIMIPARALPTVCLLFLHLSVIRADDVTADNLTIQQSATIAGGTAFGTVYTGLSANDGTGAGLYLDVTQASAEIQQEITHTSVVEGHNEWQWVTVDDYGMVESGGHYETVYTWGITGQEWVPPVYDEFGNEIAAGYYQDVYGDVPTGQNWVLDYVWGVTGSHQEYVEVWIPETTSTWTETVYNTEYGTPRIQFTATRSDANFVWRVPSTTEPGQGKDVMVVWDGGMRIPSADPRRMMSLNSDHLTQSISSEGEDVASTTHTRVAAEEMRAKTVSVYASGAEVEVSNVVHPEYLRLTREDRAEGVSTAVQTQIGAGSATFGGPVQVQGNLAVRGVARVLPAGDLDMGPFTEGPQP